MSNTTHSITLQAKESGLQQVFNIIKKGAADDVAALKALGRDGSAALKQVESQAKTTSRSFDDMKKGATAVGAGLGTLTAAASLTGRAFQDQERQISAIRRAYGESADSMLDFAESMQDAGIASNDMTRDAEQTAATLIRNYGFTADEIQRVIQTSADLAAVNGTTLADATERVVAALRGETESSEALGLTLNQQAIDREGVTLTMSNQEAAHFRLNAVLEQSAYAQGAAAERADTAAGAARRYTYELQDLVQKAGGAIGPLGEVASVLGDVALAAPMVGAGAGKVATGISTLVSALGPVGIVGAAGAATIGVFALADALTTSFSEAAGDATLAADTLAGSINELAAAGDPRALMGQAWEAKFQALSTPLGDLTSQLDAIDGQILDLQTGLSFLDNDERQSREAQIGTLNQQRDALLAKQAADREALGVTMDATAFEKERQETLIALNKIITNNGVGAEAAINNVVGLWAAYDQGAFTFPVLMDAIQATGNDLTHFDTVALKASESGKKLAESTNLIASSAEGARAAMAYLGPELSNVTNKYGAWIVAQRNANNGVVALTDAQHLAAGAMQRQESAAASMAAAQQDVSEATAEYIDLRHEEQLQRVARAEGVATSMASMQTDAIRRQNEELKAARDAAVGYAQALVGAGSFASKIRPVDIDVRGGDKVTGSAAQLQQTAGVLDSVLGTFKQLDSLGQAADQAGSIAQNLIGNPGELATIDSLLAKNRISQSEYDDALQAGITIRKEAGAIENDLNTIRAKQLPLLAEADVQYGNVIDKISKMNAEQAQATIGFMDTNEAMKAQNAVALAAAAAQSEVGSAARESATAIIEGAVAADPVLESMLTQIGLVSRDHKGNLVINFDNADSLNASTDALRASIDALTIALGGVPPEVKVDVKEEGAEETKRKVDAVTGAAQAVPPETNTAVKETGADSTRSAIFGVTEAANNVPDRTDTSLNASDNASGTIAAVANELAILNGTTATVYVQGVSVGAGIGPHALGGMVGAAGGRLVNDLQRVRANEGGIEKVSLMSGDDFWLPTGSMVVPHAASVMGDRDRGGGRTFNNYGTLIVQANNPAEFHAWAESYGAAGR